MSTLNRKTWRDLWLYRARTALVVLAIAVGTAAAGVATTSFVVLRGDLQAGYAGTNPAHAVLSLAAAIDEATAARAEQLPEVGAADVRRLTPARLGLPDGEERFLQLWTLPDFDPAVGALYPQPGATIPPPTGTVLLERSAATALGIAQGDTVTIRPLEDGRTEATRLEVVGFVNDLSVPPTTVQPSVSAYISAATAARLGLPADYNQLRLRTSAVDPDRATAERAATAVTEWLATGGAIVTRADVPEPGVHIMQDSVDTGLLMIGLLGGLTVLLGAFLVTNVMGAVATQQTPIIGVLKALGGGRRLVAAHYGRMVLLIGLMALAIAVPLGLMGAWFMSSYLAGQLNFDIPSFGLPWQTVVVQLAGALLVPLLAALGPVRAAANTTIREALSPTRDAGHETSERNALGSLFASRISYLLAWRNVGRRRGRLVLTLAALSLAGALFVATFGLARGLDEAVEILVGEFPADVVIDLAGSEPAQRLEREAAAVAAQLPAIDRVEAWAVADARRMYGDGRTGGSFTLYGVPETARIAPRAERSGRWLDGDDRATADSEPLPELYINYETEKLMGGPAVGEALQLQLNGLQEQTARLVGIGLRPFDANAYMPLAAFEAATGERGRAGRVMVYMNGADAATQAQAAAALSARFEAAGMSVLRVDTAADYRANYAAQFNTLVVLLMALAGLTALVGGLGLANTMALNVLERSREIGILRSMGSGRGLLRRLVLVEGLTVALMGGVIGIALAPLLTAVLDRVMGGTLLGSPLAFAFAPGAALGWLGLALIIGLAACWLPAENAARMTVREAVGYE